MANCKFCGKPAGWFISEHDECAVNHKRGLRRMDELAEEAAITGTGLQGLRDKLSGIATRNAIDPAAVDAALRKGLRTGLARALDDHVLSDEELHALNEYRARLGITPSRRYKDQLRKAAFLASLLQRGALPKPHLSNFGYGKFLPFNLLKSESLLWIFEDVEYLTEVTRKEFVSGSQGVSVRVAKGVYYRTGGSRGRTVKKTSMEKVDTGVMGITTKHLYFKGAGLRGKSFRIRLNRIVSFEAFDDAVGLMRDTQRAKPEAFRTGDGWFTVNLLRVAAYAMEGDGFVHEERTLDEIVAVGLAMDSGNGGDALVLEGEV